MRLLVISMALVALAACVPLASGTTIVATDKTIVDHVVSLASRKDCSIVRVEKDLTYCKEDEIDPNPKMFCYQTLGTVTCYSEEDSRYQKVDSNAQNNTTRGRLPTPSSR
ncbi:MAG: hypothetical protein ACPGOV_03815 [Magnetovibrionaceae bacterium]